MLKGEYYDDLIRNLYDLPKIVQQVQEILHKSMDHSTSQATISNYDNVKGGPFIITSETFFDTPNPMSVISN